MRGRAGAAGRWPKGRNPSGCRSPVGSGRRRRMHATLCPGTALCEGSIPHRLMRAIAEPACRRAATFIEPPPARMRSGRVPWPLLVLIAGLACGPSAPPASRLETVIRLADHVVSPSPSAVLHTAVDVQHDGQVRRALVSRPSFRWPAAWAPYGVNMGYMIDLPDQARAWNAVLVTREVSPGVRLAQQVTPLDGAPLRVRPIPLEQERAGEVFVQIQPAVQLSDLDVETDPVQVPRDARLKFAISSSGLARSELADHRAFEARIVAFDGAGEHEVFSARIEVPRDEELPWEDQSVDIGALGGRSVRFR